MTFYIYENWRAGPHKAIIHSADCSFCNYGRGVSGGTASRNGAWHGPFNDIDQALSAQKALGVKIEKRHSCAQE